MRVEIEAKVYVSMLRSIMKRNVLLLYQYCKRSAEFTDHERVLEALSATLWILAPPHPKTQITFRTCCEQLSLDESMFRRNLILQFTALWPERFEKLCDLADAYLAYEKALNVATA